MRKNNKAEKRHQRQADELERLQLRHLGQRIGTGETEVAKSAGASQTKRAGNKANGVCNRTM